MSTPRTDAVKIRCGFQAVPEPMLKHAQELERENATLRVDKERLDWLGKTKCAYFHEGPFVWRINEDETTDGDTIRAAIDAAMKEKP